MFCPNCGSQLQEGVICVCQQAVQPQAAAPAPAPVPQTRLMCIQCNVPAPKNSGQFCGTCGNAYQHVALPTYEGGGVCPHCGVQVPVGSGQRCTHCGRAFSGGATVNLPANLNLEGMSKFASGLSDKLGISVHRMIICAAAILGMLACLLPWYGARESFMGYTARLTVNAFRARVSAAGFSVSEVHGLGIVVFILFILAIALCFLENKIKPLEKFGKFVYAGIGGLAFIITITRFGNEYFEGGGIRFGFILLLLMSIAVGALPFIKKLENL